MFRADRAVIQTGKVAAIDDGGGGAFASIRIYLLCCILILHCTVQCARKKLVFIFGNLFFQIPQKAGEDRNISGKLACPTENSVLLHFFKQFSRKCMLSIG